MRGDGHNRQVRAGSRSRSRIAAVDASPSITGICTSMKTRSNVPAETRSAASWPFTAIVTRWPSFSSMRCRSLRFTLTSSATRIRSWRRGAIRAGRVGPALDVAVPLPVRCPLFLRRLDPRGEMEGAAPALLTLEPDPAAHQLNQALRDGKTEAGPPYLRVVELSAWANSSKISACFAAGMPMPVSRT